MRSMPRTVPILLSLALLAACRGDADRELSANPPADSAAPAPGDSPAPAAVPSAWRMNPAQGTTLTPGATTVVETGPHTVLWPEGAAELAPPYTVRAELRKRSGRLHEGYGLVFGGTGLDSAEAAQGYSYFLVRGDGSFLVKRRAGAETPVVQDWTRHPRITRDADGTGRPNLLEARVGADTTVFLVNDAEVARIPSSALAVRGAAGLRVSHEVVLEVAAFQAGADSAAAAGAP
jgi:hypothetical protein